MVCTTGEAHQPWVCSAPTNATPIVPAVSEDELPPAEILPVEVSCQAGQAAAGCEPSPKGKTSDQGNTADYMVCIPSNPNNTDQTCDPYRTQLESKAGSKAWDTCVNTHKVVCTKTTCQDTCVNTATMVSSQGMYLISNSRDCKAGEDACQLGNTGWDCTCDCQVQL